jgi:hypothetical protein
MAASRGKEMHNFSGKYIDVVENMTDLENSQQVTYMYTWYKLFLHEGKGSLFKMKTCLSTLRQGIITKVQKRGRVIYIFAAYEPQYHKSLDLHVV